MQGWNMAYLAHLLPLDAATSTECIMMRTLIFERSTAAYCVGIGTACGELDTGSAASGGPFMGIPHQS
jgi:hypothetical protein